MSLNPSRVWFTADTHFGHKNSIKFTDGPFEDISEMELAFIKAINSTVPAYDELYILGDFTFRISLDEAIGIRKKITCKNVHLIPGNHDKNWENLDCMKVEPLIHNLHMSDGRTICLCHYPIESWPSMIRGALHLHGHIHSKGQAYNLQQIECGKLRYDVGVDANNYKPVSLQQILEFFNLASV